MILACLFFCSMASYQLFTRYVVQMTEVVGGSMLPTLRPGDRCVVQKWFYIVAEPQRGDVVAILLPDDETPAVKRIIAMPGDRVKISGGRVLVNGERIVEPYLTKGLPTPGGKLKNVDYRVDDGCYFVLGDNRGNSLDSRFFGAVPAGWILGRIAGASWAPQVLASR